MAIFCLIAVQGKEGRLLVLLGSAQYALLGDSSTRLLTSTGNAREVPPLRHKAQWLGFSANETAPSLVRPRIVAALSVGQRGRPCRCYSLGQLLLDFILRDPLQPRGREN